MIFESVNGNRESVNGNRESVNGNRESVNGNRESVNGNREMPFQPLLSSGFDFYIKYINYIK